MNTKQLNLNVVADKTLLNFENQRNLSKKSVETREGKPEYVFYEQTAFCQRNAGIHHAMARALKDIFVIRKQKRKTSFP